MGQPGAGAGMSTLDHPSLGWRGAARRERLPHAELPALGSARSRSNRGVGGVGGANPSILSMLVRGSEVTLGTRGPAVRHGPVRTRCHRCAKPAIALPDQVRTG
jgi:hypothetical protein